MGTFSMDDRPLQDIYLLHHSHYDRGYTHSQVVIDQLQVDFINQAIEMLEATRDWEAASQPRWTIEVHEQLRRWLEYADAADIQRMRDLVSAGRIGLGAIQYNTTPLSSVESLCKQLVTIPRYRRELGFPVRVAFQHDVTGVPWVMSDLLLDAGVELLVMAINLHTGGNGPKRPGYFKWRTPSGRILKVFSGHHYGTFDAITEPVTTPLLSMKAQIDTFWQGVVDGGYPHDFLYLTTTHSPVADDNGAPCIMTAEKVREWNRQPGYPPITYVTPELLLEKLRAIPDSLIPEHRGDWTDFWNYGAGSTALETAMNGDSKRKLYASALLGARLPDDRRLKALQRQAWDEVICFEEHTWGMAPQASNPNHAHCVTVAMHKRNLAHTAQELARYVLASRLASHAGNPVMHRTEGLLAVNPSAMARRVTLAFPPRWTAIYGHLHGFQYRHSEVFNLLGELQEFLPSGGRPIEVALAPFSVVRIPWEACPEPQADASLIDGVAAGGSHFVESATHRLVYQPGDGRILSLLDKQTGWEAVLPDDDYDLLTPVHEKPDPAVDGSRQSYYRRDCDKERRLGSCWNPDWKALRSGPSALLGCRVMRTARTISLVREYAIEGASRVIQKFDISADCPWIEVGIIIHKDRIETPESLYFASRFNLQAEWEAEFDASGIPVRLDTDQLEQTSRGWVTAEAFTRMADRSHQVAVFAPDIPLVQFGTFHFGKPPVAIPRPAAPLHLLWVCNNYWETNFPITQEGVIRLSCAIHTSGCSDRAALYRLADAYARKPLFLPLASCPSRRDEPLLRVSNPGLRLVSVDAASSCDGNIYRLANYQTTVQEGELDVGARICSAVVVSPTEAVLADCEFKDSSVCCTIPPNAVLSILVNSINR